MSALAKASNELWNLKEKIKKDLNDSVANELTLILTKHKLTMLDVIVADQIVRIETDERDAEIVETPEVSEALASFKVDLQILVNGLEIKKLFVWVKK